MVLPAEPPLVQHSTSGAEAQECGYPELKSRYLKVFVSHGLSLQHVRLGWRCFSAVDSSVNAIFTLEENVALTKSASPATNAALPKVVVPTRRLLSNPAMSSD